MFGTINQHIAKKLSEHIANIIDVPSGREYHILGKYKFDFEKSTNKKHILKKVEEI